jgi:hypothetical protein
MYNSGFQTVSYYAYASDTEGSLFPYRLNLPQSNNQVSAGFRANNKHTKVDNQI